MPFSSHTSIIEIKKQNYKVGGFIGILKSMQIFKKLIFSLPFLIAFTGYCLTLKSFLVEPTLILGISQAALEQMVLFCICVMLTAFFFILFTTCAQEWKFVLAIIPATTIAPMLFLPSYVNFLFSILCLLAFGLVCLLLQSKLNSYLTFNPNTLLAPSITQTVTLLLFASSVVFYLASDAHIKQEGFKIPPSLIDSIMRFMPSQSLPIPQNLIKETIDTQVQSFIKPYLSFIPIILTVLFFITMKSFSSILSLFLHPLLWFIFWLLNKTKFTSYTVEMREVKKLVI